MSAVEMNVPARLAASLLEGYAWGQAARARSQQVGLDDLPALTSEGLNAAFRDAVMAVFADAEPGPSHMERLDQIVDEHPETEALREYLADLLALHLIMQTEFEEDEDSDEDDDNDEDAEDIDPRWTTLEALFETRGTEVLHVLSYLRECKEAEEEPDLDDFLEHFVLDQDDESQDDLFVYEELIRQAEMVEGTLKQIMQTGNGQRSDTMRDLFTPLMLFFREPEPKPGMLTLAILNQSALPAIHAAIFRVLNSYWALPLEDVATLN